MIFLPSCIIHVSSDLEPDETRDSTVLPVKPEEDISRCTCSLYFLCSIFEACNPSKAKAGATKDM